MKRAHIELTAGGVLLAAVIAGIASWRWLPGQPASAPAAATAPAGLSAPPAAAAPQAELPSFDVARVAPDGRAVIAGRAAPGAEVTVLDHDTVLGKVTADSAGEWVFTPDQPLAPGTSALSLASRLPGQAEPSRSSGTVAVLVPNRKTPSDNSGVATVMLPQGEGIARPLPGGQSQPLRPDQHIGLDVVEYDGSGSVALAGRADPSAKVEIYVNDRPIGSATADAAGNWSARLLDGVPTGSYRLRLEAQGPTGKTLGQLALDLHRRAAGENGPGDYVLVVPGNTLWRLAQQSYGVGTRYFEIYRANRARISDPNRIYPGQLLAVPTRHP